MKLKKIRVREFKSIMDSNDVDITDITCLVGKNESGKTAFLQALYRLNPARPNVSFSVPDHYPAWLEKKDRQKGTDLKQVQPVDATFDLSSADVEALESRFGKGTVK